jgi:NAD(P)-dependent dehydrogenase (short-subunit alcohol dehydrogenase family)
MSESPPNGRLAGRIALVTGASRGIGRSIALRFAFEGAQVIVAARTQAGLEELDDEIQAAGGQRAVLVPVDLTDYDQIDAMGATIYQRFGRLDVLVGNAAILGQMRPLTHIDPPAWEEALAINVTANWRLIRSCDPLLRQSAAGRAIFVTSGVAQQPRAYWGAYATTKAALEALVQTYAAETEKTNIRVNLLNPGKTRTAMRAAAMPGEDPSSLKPPEALGDLFVELASANCERHGERLDAN